MNEQAFWLAWLQVPGLGPVLLKRLQDHFGSLATAWNASAAEWLEIEGIGEQLVQAIQRTRSSLQPIEWWQQHRQTNPDFWTPADADYPRLLLETPNYPPVLYYRGIVDRQENIGQQPTIAVVGTRYPSDYAIRWTRRLTKALVRQGFTIVSGLAQGIDSVAHQACLESGGRTIAVLGTGVDQVYPPQHQLLYQKLIGQGLAVSEYCAGTQPDRPHFPQRNRIIAGLSRAVLVMEAPLKSGALITAYMANDYGRDVYVLPGYLDNPRCLGALGLISRGAQVILGEEHLLEMLKSLPGLLPPLLSASANVQQLSLLPLDLPAEWQQVLAAIGHEPLSLDAIVAHSQLATAQVSSTLLQLELAGWVSQLPGMRYQRADNLS